MKPLLVTTPALLLAAALSATPAPAQSLPYASPPPVQPYVGPDATPYAAQTPVQPYAAPGYPFPRHATAPPYAGAASADLGQTSSRQQPARSGLPQGPYLNECREVRMLEGTLTAFCPRGDGTWHTTQLVAADRCSGHIDIAGGDLVCATPPQIGSTAPPQAYASSAGGAYADPAPAPPPGPAVALPPGPYAPVPAPAYGAPVYPPVPSQDLYTSPSAGRTAQPWGY